MNILFAFEHTFLKFIRNHFTCGFMDFIMPKLSFINTHGEVWILVAVILVCTRKYRESGLRLMLALFIGGVLCNLILKPTVARIRPFDINTAIELIVNPPADFSFPSGHTVSSFLAVPILWKANKKFGIAALILAILIAFSRLYLCVHYPTDILAGIVLGLAIGFSVSKIRFKNETNKNTGS